MRVAIRSVAAKKNVDSFTAFVFTFVKGNKVYLFCNKVTLNKHYVLKLAAIDIGSNAVRLQISAVLDGANGPVFKKVEYVRFPLRLGQDVFTEGSISELAEQKFVKLMQAYKLLLELFEVDDYFACATSAMRTAANGEALAQKVLEQTGISINIINGEQEASYIDLAITDTLDAGHYLHIDVGGGSTELNLYHNHIKKASESFSLGSVRNLQGKDSAAEWHALESWVKKHLEKINGKALALGTGGNISKLYNMAGKKTGQYLSLKKLQELRNYIDSLSVQDRIHKLQLNPDRADVIVPAADLYLKIMRWAGCTSIKVPAVGLKDGLLKHLYQQQN
ncbi:Ppx/GppA phosphatase [Flammeovirgaceae bacterium 311]|nr:Ppx/GppA phosphatase [Flammeovirgaceae bacterium 311]